MKVAAIEKELKAFISKHSVQFEHLSIRETALLELGALTMATEHYRLAGYTITVENAINGLFAAKLSSRGHPYNFSWFKCVKGKELYEIHSNLSVMGGHKDEAVYVVDVAVVIGDDHVPKAKPKKKWVALNNKALATFAEVKKLVVYPMLLAQFIGIVHEITPSMLKKLKAGTVEDDHFPPSLITLGYLTATSGKALKGFAKRKFRVCVVHNFDMYLSQMRRGEADKSPFVMVQSLI
ncbi:hypothetical protein [Mesorhizobium sp. AA23]|uniref:hypothetical protein n=1 Tax=Mesorhizobium sp. AA23 TaxID=1854058 RepID=UPI0007FB944F|nr:hypothetical protein [Mesorhizobium sp. AA23]OBQ92498.1 hypothetical protein A9K66_10630 [Mesorhizobium sp. AA23]